MADSLYEIPINDEFVNQILDKPEKFIVPDDVLEKKILGVTKNLFDFGIKKEENSSCPLEELYIEGFDNDQIWEEIQLQNIPLIEQFNEISNDIIENDLQMSEDEEEEEEEENEFGEFEDEEYNEDENEDDNEDGNEYENEDEIKDENDEKEDNEDNDEDMLEDEDLSDEDLDKKEKSSNSNRKFKKTVVDDQFFSLREMEAFAEEFERKDILRSRRFNKEEGEEDDENDEGMEDEDYEYMNFDQDFDDEDDDMEIRYEDFFAPPEEYENNKGKDKDIDHDKINDEDNDNMEDDNEEVEEENEEEGEEEGEEDLDDDGFPNLHGNEEDEEEEDNGDDKLDEEDDEEKEEDDGQNLTTKISNLFSEDNEEEEGGEVLSTFEKSQKKMQETIEKLEEEAIADKHWALKGEVSSKARPLNSLLEEDLEVEHASKPVPVITEEVTQTLEDMIRQRILDNLFDDVERKIDINTLKPKYDPNKQFELFEEQKKQSLSEVYENEYLRQTAGEHQSEKELELEKRHQEIDELFKKLCQNLDALSNWHYAPKPAKMEMTVVSNVPSIQMEEVLPIHESENTLLAPEETYEKPKTDVKGETEIDSAEKKRQRSRRRKIKKLERKQKEKEQKIRAKILPNSISQKYGNKKQALETLTGNKNVTIISNSSLNLPGGKKKKGNSAKVISTAGGKTSSNENRQTSLKL